MARDIIAIAFKEGATIEQKRAAVALISGRVVGGVKRCCGSSAFYLVRIPDPREKYLEVLVQAKARLVSLDQVAYVTFYILTEPARNRSIK